MIVSPCISICKKDTKKNLCLGCFRSVDEITKWKNINTTEEWKENNLKLIKARMNKKQLHIFVTSYEYKCLNGISLIKKQKLEKVK